MEYIWIILAIICAAIGLIGAIVPMLPGPPIGYIALWMMWLYDKSSISSTTLWIMGALMIAVSIIDYVAPIWITNLGGGSKQSMHGATIGLIIGLFFGPIGLIAGPFIGALLGELSTKAPFGQAISIALLSFISFILTTWIKFIYGISIAVIIFMALWN